MKPAVSVFLMLLPLIINFLHQAIIARCVKPFKLWQFSFYRVSHNGLLLEGNKNAVFGRYSDFKEKSNK